VDLPAACTPITSHTPSDIQTFSQRRRRESVSSTPDWRASQARLGRPYNSDVPAEDCFICAKHGLGDAAPGGVLFEDELVYAGHAYPVAEQVSAPRGYLAPSPGDMLRDWEISRTERQLPWVSW
jgi:hypothetical protein